LTQRCPLLAHLCSLNFQPSVQRFFASLNYCTTKMASTLLRNNETIRFYNALNWEDQDQRTAHGVEVRRERKQRKKQRKKSQAEEDLRSNWPLPSSEKQEVFSRAIDAFDALCRRTPFRTYAGARADIDTVDRQLHERGAISQRSRIESRVYLASIVLSPPTPTPILILFLNMSRKVSEMNWWMTTTTSSKLQ
jgi:hypothetical protein